MLLDACEYFIRTVDFSSRLKTLPTVRHSIPSEAVAFILRLAGHVAGTLSPMPINNECFGEAVDTLFDTVTKTEDLWSQARIRAAWVIGLRNTLANRHQNNRIWLSDHGKLPECFLVCVVYITLVRIIIAHLEYVFELLN